ncbi:Metallo-hydrolase/oxidoreductase [Basidiobolus meristosporus CBS 931.73]|uniref:Metallo-hydrolase/oxidoreductase n=1 Tax=Basidiobolus meristosporus CBS 931.73 TaxID=1314790 RepID=A0A1Y1XX77_9FUNG|nr:Metallo-hydrolase/oxidoreductase [Basidiobolus meristosporus CBS 931.73]|eukprot:ORX90359.1 Metallo-hydrolase/oxidoreductase [Basidiobolus meristosporus CBS 931.73]
MGIDGNSAAEEANVKGVSEPEFVYTTRNREHHLPNGGFQNPWKSFTNHGFCDMFALLKDYDRQRCAIPPKEKLVPVLTPDFELLNKPEGKDFQLTWLGHACFLLQVDGINILFDPVFSDRCSPFQFVGPKRYTPPPCKIEELPKIDIVVISHNHYDHLDYNTVKALGDGPRYFVPLGNKKWFESVGIRNVVECDWWDETEVSLEGARDVKIVCTPCQHFTGRGVHDRFQTLWASWCVITKDEGKFYFAGDTGYRSVPKTKDEDSVPYCPAFLEIGHKYGPFDLACIPIGAYSPRWFMSPIHCSPEDAVRVHEDIRSKKSVGMHWATWVLTDEDVTEPPRRLKQELQNRKHNEEDFITIEIGRTIHVPKQ